MTTKSGTGLCGDATKGDMALERMNSARTSSSTANVVVWKRATDGFYGVTPAWLSAHRVPAIPITDSEVN